MGLTQLIKKYSRGIAVSGVLAFTLGAFFLKGPDDSPYQLESFGYLDNNPIPDAIKTTYTSDLKENRLTEVYVNLNGRDSTKLIEIKGLSGYVHIRDVNGDGKNDVFISASNRDRFGFWFGSDYDFIFLGNGGGTFQPVKKEERSGLAKLGRL